MAEGDKSWWTTMPGLLTALAAIITAVGGLVAAVGQAGLFGGKNSAPAAPSAAVAPQAAAVESARPQAPPPAQPSAAAEPAAAITGVRVTTKAGDVVVLRPTATILGATMPLKSGQEVPFERIERIDFTQPWDGTLKLVLVGGASIDGSSENLPLSGSNELGAYLKMLSEIRRIEFVRQVSRERPPPPTSAVPAPAL